MKFGHNHMDLSCNSLKNLFKFHWNRFENVIHDVLRTKKASKAKTVKQEATQSSIYIETISNSVQKIDSTYKKSQILFDR